jgi:hypothetical protein
VPFNPTQNLGSGLRIRGKKKKAAIGESYGGLWTWVLPSDAVDVSAWSGEKQCRKPVRRS